MTLTSHPIFVWINSDSVTSKVGRALKDLFVKRNVICKNRSFLAPVVSQFYMKNGNYPFGGKFYAHLLHMKLNHWLNGVSPKCLGLVHQPWHFMRLLIS